MAPRTAFQLLLVFLTLATVDSSRYGSSRLLSDFFLSHSFEGNVYVVTKEDLYFDKVTTESTCRQAGGYLAKLGSYTGEFEFVKKVILQSRLHGSVYLIGEAGKDALDSTPYPISHEAKCTIIVKLTGSENFYVMKSTSCNYDGHIICEVPLTSSTSAYTGFAEIYKTFHVSPSYQGSRVYLIHKNEDVFDISASNKVCVSYGGYLWEFGTRDEYNFVLRYINRLGLRFYVIFTGAEYSYRAGQFVWHNSERAVAMPHGTRVPWVDVERQSSSQCMAIYNNVLKLFPCHLIRTRYICEIPTEMHE